MVLSDAELVAFVPTHDLESSDAFYSGVLELTRIDASPFANVYDVEGVQLRVTLAPESPIAPHTVLGWQVSELVGAIRRLAAAGVEFTRYDGMGQDEDAIWTSPSGARIAWFRDPDGNTLSLQQL